MTLVERSSLYDGHWNGDIGWPHTSHPAPRVSQCDYYKITNGVSRISRVLSAADSPVSSFLFSLVIFLKEEYGGIKSAVSSLSNRELEPLILADKAGR